MNVKRATRWSLFLGALLLAGFRGADTAEEVLQASGIQGGLVVHLGCGDGKLTAGLHRDARFVVHGLDTDAEKIREARRHIRSLKLCGKVSVDLYDGKRLPYVDELVNLLVVSDAGGVAKEELLRVLAPEGVLCVREGGAWKKTVKPRPAEIDTWTHFLHDAGSNAVAKDMRVGSPRRLRWVVGPLRCRSHEFPSSVYAVVATGERIFMIFDEAPCGVYQKLPQKCMIVARDAFSGVLLWKVPLRQWDSKYGTGTGNRWNIHHTLPRRLVAQGDRVYATLGFLDSPVSVLDAASGKILTEALEGTKGTDEMILSDGVLVVKITKKRSVGATARIEKSLLDDTLAAVDVKTGKALWRKEKARVVPYALSALDGRVVYHNMDELVCLDARTGKEVWRVANEIGSTQGGVSNLILTDGVVLFSGNTKTPSSGGGADAKAGKGKKKGGGARFILTALSLRDGKPLWSGPCGKGWSAACTQPADVFVANGLVWTGSSTEGRDLRTGEVKKKVTIDKLISPGHHYRCHRSKATERFLILPKRGAEFVDLQGDDHMRNDWLRAPCFTGLTPANGLLYVPPDQCFCYPGVKVSGFLAMSAEPADKLKPSGAEALHRGTVYDKIPGGVKAGDEDWPMYRRDARRSGFTPVDVPTKLVKRWEVELACKGSQPVVVGDRLWVAEKDAQRIVCLSVSTGKEAWSFTAGGRIDSAPTVSDGALYFGCRDGSVYCLSAADGKLAWRFRAAPKDRRAVSFEQVESLWPVHGSVLVRDGKVYFAAGRSSFLDGGILVYALEAKTGKVLHQHYLEGPWPDIRTDDGSPFAMEGALPDLMVGVGKDLYMGRIKFDASLNRIPLKPQTQLGEMDMGALHLAATGGFLDDSGYDRIFWMHSRWWPGFYLSPHSPKAGQIIVFDEKATYAVKQFYRRHQWSPFFTPNEKGYLLFADDNANEPTFVKKGGKTSAGLEWLPKEAYSDKYRRGGQGTEKGTGYVREKPSLWQKMIPLRVRGMVLAGDRLFTAGAPDVVDEKDPLAAFEGRKGGRLEVFSAKDGSSVTSLELPSPPAFDGLIAARGALFLATEDGRLICFSGGK